MRDTFRQEISDISREKIWDTSKKNTTDIFVVEKVTDRKGSVTCDLVLELCPRTQ